MCFLAAVIVCVIVLIPGIVGAPPPTPTPTPGPVQYAPKDLAAIEAMPYHEPRVIEGEATYGDRIWMMRLPGDGWMYWAADQSWVVVTPRRWQPHYHQ